MILLRKLVIITSIESSHWQIDGLWEMMEFLFDELHVLPWWCEEENLIRELEPPAAENSLILCDVDTAERSQVERVLRYLKDLRQEFLSPHPILLTSGTNIDLRSADWISFSSLGAVYSCQLPNVDSYQYLEPQNVSIIQHLKNECALLSNSRMQGYAAAALYRLESMLLDLSKPSDQVYTQRCCELSDWIEELINSATDIPMYGEIKQYVHRLRSASIPQLSEFEEICGLLNELPRMCPTLDKNLLHKAKGRAENLRHRHPDALQPRAQYLIKHLELILSGKMDILGDAVNILKPSAYRLHQVLAKMQSSSGISSTLAVHVDDVRIIIEGSHRIRQRYHTTELTSSTGLTEVFIVESDDAFRESVITVLKQRFSELTICNFDNLMDAAQHLENLEMEASTTGQDISILVIMGLHLPREKTSRGPEVAELEYGEALLARLHDSSLHAQVTILSAEANYSTGMEIVLRSGVKMLDYIFKSNPEWENQLVEKVQEALPRMPHNFVPVGVDAIRRIGSIGGARLELTEKEALLFDILLYDYEPLTAQEIEERSSSAISKRWDDTLLCAKEVPSVIYGLKSKIADVCRRHRLDIDTDQILVIDSSHNTIKYNIRGWRPIDRPSEEAIFLVEDDAMLRSDIRHRLEMQKFKVIEASSYEEALRALTSPEERSFPVAILDLGIPAIEDGISVLKQLIRRSPDTEVIVLTRYGHDEVKGLAIRSGLSPNRYIR